MFVEWLQSKIRKCTWDIKPDFSCHWIYLSKKNLDNFIICLMPVSSFQWSLNMEWYFCRGDFMSWKYFLVILVKHFPAFPGPFKCIVFFIPKKLVKETIRWQIQFFQVGRYRSRVSSWQGCRHILPVPSQTSKTQLPTWYKTAHEREDSCGLPPHTASSRRVN